MFDLSSFRTVSSRFSVVVAVVFLHLAACAERAPDGETPRKVARQIDTLFLDLARKELSRRPETATQMGISEEALGFSVHSRVNDRSQAGFERARLDRLEIVDLLENAPLPPIGSARRRHLDAVLSAYRASAALAEFGHGRSGPGILRPYAMDQLTGGYLDLPEILMRRQTVRTVSDAEAWLVRLSQLDDTIADETRRLKADADAGIIPPQFILTRMSVLARSFGDIPLETHPLKIASEDILLGVTDTDFEGQRRLAERARHIIEADVLPAYLTLASELEQLSFDAPNNGGLWKLDGGSDWYRAALGYYASDPEISTEAVHKFGTELVWNITAQLDIALTDQGLIEGSVGERLAMLAVREDQAFPNDEDGRAELLQYMRGELERIEPAVAPLLAREPRSNVTITQVPKFLQATAPGGYYTPAPADASAPGFFFINLRDTAEWPRFALPTLVFHETIPGHHVESSTAAEVGELPLIRQMIWNAAFGEGWALYAEDLADEIGIYEADPLGRIGYLQSLLFRAARVAADTGMHQMRWSREETVDYLVTVTGQPRSAMETEVDRYAVWPAQATAYMLGRERIWELRRRAMNTLGDQFDLAAFHHAILSGGPRPLEILEADIDRWIAAQVPGAG